MKQATVAGITVAMGPVLQGCGDPDEVADSCVGRSANQCIKQNMESECAWDLETVEEACFLQPDFDEALFNATKPAGQDFSNAPVESGLNFEGCAEFDAVIAQRCLSQCEINSDYKMDTGDPNIRLDNLVDDFQAFSSEEMAFYLPNIAVDRDDIPDTFLTKFQAGEALYADLVTEAGEPTGFKPDWSPFGSDLADHRLRMTGTLGGAPRLLFDYDSRYEESGDHQISFAGEYTLGGETLQGWVDLAQGSFPDEEDETAAVKLYLSNEVFGDKDSVFVDDVWFRFSVLDALSKKADPSSYDQPSIVQADLDDNAFMWNFAFDKCSSDRNCGVDFASGQCAKLEDYCAQWTQETCPGDQTWSQKISMPTLAEGPAQDPVDIGGGKERQVDGYMYYADEATAKCQFYEDLSEGHCGLPDEFVTCETIGFPTQLGENNVCFFYDLQPVPWAAPVYDEAGEIVAGYDVNKLETFASFYETVLDNEGNPVVLGGVNPRGCITTGSSDLEEAEFLGSKYGYGGPVCTYPAGWDCLVNDDPDTEPGCDVTEASICLYQEASFGECITSDQFYTKYFVSINDTDTPLYESVTVVFSEIGEEDLDDADEDEDEDDAAEDEDGGEEEEEMPADRIA